MAAPWEEYAGTAPPVVAPATSAAPWEEYASQPPGRDKFDLRGDGFDKIQNYDGRNAIGGAVRGLASLGATVIRPFESADANEQRRAKVDRGMAEFLGADPDSTAYKTNKLVVEGVATLPIGGLIGKGLSAIPGATTAIPNLIAAIKSGGMSVNGAKGLYGMATRTAGGAVNGAVTAGAVNPDDATTGATINALLPGAVKVVGTVGSAIGSKLAPATLNPTLQKTVQDSVNAGYVIPPASVNPSFVNRVLESISGKQATQQIVSTKNTQVTEGLVRDALGIPADVPLSQGTLEGLRKTAGKAYQDVANISPKAAADLEALKQARNDAQGWFNAYNRSASPDDLAKAKAAKALSDQLETALESHAAAANQPELIPALRDARTQIAKTYTVGRALNDASGTIDARVLGRMYEKGAPLSDELATAGKFASAFPTAAKSPQQIGSPDVHNLKAMLSLALSSGGATGAALHGVGAAATGGLGLLAGAVPFIAPPVARSILLRQGAQQALGAAPAPSAIRGLLSDAADESLPLMYRSGGLLATSGQ